MKPSPALPAPARRLLSLLLALTVTSLAPLASASDPTPPHPQPAGDKSAFRILKVLPHYLDRDGRHSVNPSLFDRDAYQFELRQNPELRSGLRFDVLWKTAPGTPAALTVKLELRGTKAPEQAPVLVAARGFARGGFSQWTRVPIRGKDYEALGELLAWRVTLWKDDHQVAEQTSFLW